MSSHLPHSPSLCWKGECLQCWFSSSEAMKFCAKTRNSHDCFVPSPFCCLWKKTVSKLHSQNWKKHYDLHSVYDTKVAAGVSCIATVSVAVRGTHEKEEMETEPVFTLGLFLELFICHICVWSSQCLDSWAKTKLKSWNN